jgi:hypothetical protein
VVMTVHKSLAYYVPKLITAIKEYSRKKRNTIYLSTFTKKNHKNNIEVQAPDLNYNKLNKKVQNIFATRHPSSNIDHKKLVGHLVYAKHDIEGKKEMRYLVV